MNGSDIAQWIHVRSEEVAAFASGAEARCTGLAVCAGSCGPGNPHLINGCSTFTGRAIRLLRSPLAFHRRRTGALGGFPVVYSPLLTDAPAVDS